MAILLADEIGAFPRGIGAKPGASKTMARTYARIRMTI
jgi:hypothetical protein